MKFYNKTKNKMTLGEKMEYIHKHYQYYTMNSWNGTKGLANIIKLYTLPLTKEQMDKAYDIVCNEDTCNDFWDMVAFRFEDFGKVFTNGRNNGYIVYNYNMIDSVADNETYQYIIDYYKEYYGYTHREAQKQAKEDINIVFNDVVDFDNFCDMVLEDFIAILDNYDIKKETYTTEHTRKILCEKGE